MIESNQDSASFDEGLIFYDLNDLVEYVEDYRPGGYHPMRLGDRLRDGRYLILRKLGYGSYSTVWLARDSILTELVALKVMKARCSDQRELKIYSLLANDAEQHPGRFNIMSLKDHFKIQGPNGLHSCLVYEVMGPSISNVMQERAIGEVWLVGQRKRFTLSAARTMIYDLLLGLDYLYSKGLAHGDFHAGNSLFSLNDISEVSTEDLRQSGDMVSAPVRRLDGCNDACAPQRLTLDQPLREWVATAIRLQLKVSDLGSAFFLDSPPTDPKTPVDVRSPELLLCKRISAEQDVWAFGCFLYKLLTNKPLFQLWNLGNRDYLDDDHILQIISLLGPLPNDLKIAWPRYRNYFDENDVQIVFEVDWAPSISSFDDNSIESPHSRKSDLDLPKSNVNEEKYNRDKSGAFAKEVPIQQLYPSLVEVYDDLKPILSNPDPAKDTNDIATETPQSSLRERWLAEKHPEISTEEAEAVACLLQQIFQYDPAERPTTTELLRHPWIDKYCADRGIHGASVI